jgi:hypothetical protein
MNLKKLRQNSFLLALAIVFTYVCLFLETVKYPGFVGNHFYIDAKVYFALTLVLTLFSTSKSKFLKLIFKINSLLLPILLIVYLGLAALEGAHYTNYILATFHIHIDGMVILVLFSLLLYVFNKFKNLLPKNICALGIIYPAIVLSIVYFVIVNLTYVVNQAVNRDAYIIFHPLSTYDQKMFYQWGDFYRFMVFVKNNTPSDANIVIPPQQDPWLIGTGNPHFVRSFLYPRNIIREMLIIPDVKVFGPNTFILISWGKEECKPTGCHGWPRQDIFAKRIMYKDPNSESVIETKVNAIYKLEDDKYVYGVIEL